MAYSGAVITAAEAALRAADKPILGAQAIQVTPSEAKWTDNAATNGNDIGDTDAPSSRTIDGFSHFPSSPNAAATGHNYVFEFLPGIEFDFICILGHNFGTNSATCAVQIDNLGGFGSPALRAISTFTPSDDKRLSDFTLRYTGAPGGASDPVRISNVNYVRLFISAAGSFVPVIGEIILGRSYQLKHKPRTPYDDNTLVGDHETIRTAAGVTSRYTYNEAGRVLEANINPSEDPYLGDIPDWFRTADRYGRSPFVWVENPGTDIDTWHYMMLNEPMLEYPVQDFVERTFSINAREQGPERFFVEKE